MTTSIPPTWREIQEGMIENGVDDAAVLDSVRRATAPGRCAARVEEASAMLASRYGAGAVVAAALDGEGSAGPYGLGGPCGASVRVPGLERVPRHAQAAGAAWDAAISGKIGAAAAPTEAHEYALLGAAVEEGVAPGLVLLNIRGDGVVSGSSSWSGTAVLGLIEGPALAGLSPWIRAQAARAALFAVDPTNSALKGLAIPAGSPRDWVRLLREADRATAVAQLKDAVESNCVLSTTLEGALSTALQVRLEDQGDELIELITLAKAKISAAYPAAE